MNFKPALNKLKSALNQVKSHKIDLNKKTNNIKTLVDYKEKKLAYYTKFYQTSVKEFMGASSELNNLVNVNQNKILIDKIKKLIDELQLSYEKGDTNQVSSLVSEIEKEYSGIIMPVESEIMHANLGNIPSDIRGDINADIDELDRCFNNGCYRSSIILCGRILEIALHRKYYELTKNDLLEKSPGVGIGNLIAKLKEKNINIDPGLTQQIHLINQVRIFSVHKKQEAFNPTKAQTQAIIIYTLDVLDRLFKQAA